MPDRATRVTGAFRSRPAVDRPGVAGGQRFPATGGAPGPGVVRFAHGESGGRRPAVDRRLSAVRPARSGWHGTGVSGADAGGPGAGAQDRAAGIRPRSRLRRAVRPGDPQRRPGALAVDGRGGGLQPARGVPAVAGDRVRTGAVAHRPGRRAGPAAGAGRGDAGRRAVRGAADRARGGAGASRRQAVQCAAGRAATAAHRLRDRPGRGGLPAHQHRRDDRLARLHGARAGHGGGRGRAGRPVRAGVRAGVRGHRARAVPPSG